MRRLAGISALVVLLACAPVWAQRRGGAGSFHGVVAFHGAVAPRGGVVFHGSFPHTGITIRTFPGPFNHFHRFFPYYRPWWGYGYAGYYGYGYPGYGYYGAYDPLLWSSASSYASDSSSQYNAYYDQNQQLQQQVNRLQDEVDRLHDDQYSRAVAPPEPARPQPSAPDKPESVALTVLVFKDQHREEVKNYAVVGQTVWIFSEQRARKVPLQQLDIPATQRANEDRGVDFLIPG